MQLLSHVLLKFQCEEKDIPHNLQNEATGVQNEFSKAVSTVRSAYGEALIYK